MTERSQLTLDTDRSPARVLPRQPHDQLAHLRVDPGAAPASGSALPRPVAASPLGATAPPSPAGPRPALRASPARSEPTGARRGDRSPGRPAGDVRTSRAAAAAPRFPAPARPGHATSLAAVRPTVGRTPSSPPPCRRRSDHARGGPVKSPGSHFVVRQVDELLKRVRGVIHASHGRSASGRSQARSRARMSSCLPTLLPGSLRPSGDPEWEETPESLTGWSFATHDPGEPSSRLEGAGGRLWRTWSAPSGCCSRHSGVPSAPHGARAIYRRAGSCCLRRRGRRARSCGAARGAALGGRAARQPRGPAASGPVPPRTGEGRAASRDTASRTPRRVAALGRDRFGPLRPDDPLPVVARGCWRRCGGGRARPR